jgi:hypothetical protein
VAIEHSAGLEAAPSPGEPGPSRHRIFAIVAVGLFMSSIDATIVATALSAIRDSLRTTINRSALQRLAVAGVVGGVVDRVRVHRLVARRVEDDRRQQLRARPAACRCSPPW